MILRPDAISCMITGRSAVVDFLTVLAIFYLLIRVTL